MRASIEEATEKHQAALPAATKLNQHDKAINDLKWEVEQGRTKLNKALEQRDWWAQQIQEITDAQEVREMNLKQAAEAKQEFHG